MLHIEINGIVQGVGFRPFVFNLARKLGLSGYVLNSSNGVSIEVEGGEAELKRFVTALKEELPPAARIDVLSIDTRPDYGYKSFEIRPSLSSEGMTFISPDLALCNDCQEEVQNKTDPRYDYPFINCTNCGPRYSIIEKTPYDRPVTSMKEFTMCEFCRSEYEDPANRRFHAQPIACPACGPQLSFLDSSLQQLSGDPISKCLEALKDGNIVGIKGIGGFHIACDATNEVVVRELRRRKKRPDKPFAVMCEPAQVRTIVECSAELWGLLKSPAAPIILLPKKIDSPVVKTVAPLNPNLGVFLPYAPQHWLLFNSSTTPLYLVMTSGNLNDEPIAIKEEDLSGLCDFYLTHNREILNRNDDSVIAPLTTETTIRTIFFRRSRGYIPSPLKLPFKTRTTFGAGAELKIVFALSDQDKLYLSPYIGNHNSKGTADFYLETLTKYQQWFRLNPELVACDLQPDYLTTRLAEEMSLPLVRIQHHHAHIAAVMAENQLDEPVIGVSYDGTGYGPDGTIWGGEIFTAEYCGYNRRYHLNYMPLPGGDAAITHPVRITYAYLLQAEEDSSFLKGISEFEKNIISKQLENGFNLFHTSSMGRLFDAVAAMLGLFPVITFEAQSAMALEYLCGRASLQGIPPYPYQISDQVIDITPVIRAVRKDLLQGVAQNVIALRFHRTVIDFTLSAVLNISRDTGLKKVVLSGGVMQNGVLLRGLIEEISRNNFTVYHSSELPSNDGAISTGQVIIANRIIV